MNLNQFFFIGIIILGFLIYRNLFSKININLAIRQKINEAREYKNIDNFIEAKKYYFDKIEKSLGVFMGFSLLIFFGIKITGLLTLIGSTFIGIIFIFGIIFYVKFNELHSLIIENLYLEKDRKD